MEHLLIKKIDDNLYKTLNKVYDLDYYNTGKLTSKDFNEKIIILVKSGLNKEEIKDLIIRSINGEDNEFSYYIDNTRKNQNLYINNILLVLFGIIISFMIINLII